MAWAGTGFIWTIEGGVPVSRLFGQSRAVHHRGGVSFAQISDNHIGFNKPANPDVTATLQAAIDKIGILDTKPEFILHTGDLTHGAKPEEFDALDQLMKGAKRQTFYVPGEHDTAIDDGKAYLERYGKDTKGPAGIASIKAGFISSVFRTSWRWKAWASSARIKSRGSRMI
jgi:3',5'-cyclic-AMP phosphodiesterase